MANTSSKAIIPMSCASILVCGYYDRDNYGDDAFIAVLARAWGQHRLTFRNIEVVTPEEVRAADLIVLGGGDLLQEYFLTYIDKNILPYKRSPLYAVGVSIPFASVIEQGRLDMIDQFWCRFRSDTETLRKRYGAEAVHYIPDLALLTPMPKRRLTGSKKRVGLCLSMSLARGSSAAITLQLRNLIQRLLSLNYEVVWLPFNTDNGASKELESDIHLYNLLPLETRRHVVLCASENLLTTLVEMDIVIASRFHAHVFCSLLAIPVVSLVLTRKIDQWNLDHGWGRNAVKLPRACTDCTVATTNCKSCAAFMGYPTSLPIDEIVVKVRLAYKPIYNVKHDVITLAAILQQIARGLWFQRASPPYYVSGQLIAQKLASLQAQWAAFKAGQVTAETFASTVCLAVTGQAHHPFHYGLVSQVTTQPDTFDLRAALVWMLKTYYTEEPQWARGLISHQDGLVSLSKTGQHRLENSHRSGWAYSMDLLTILHREDAPLLDAFVDKTFGWDREHHEALGVIPYREPWLGFIHHPAQAVFSRNDCEAMLTQPSFQASLLTCRALFVMSSDLKQWLLEHGVTVPISVVYHPTETPLLKFSWRKFTANPCQRIVQIGAWLRDPYAIFQLDVRGIQKAVLKSKDMAGYLTATVPVVISADSDRVTRDVEDGCRDKDAPSPFLTSLQAKITAQWNSVEIIERLENEDYDRLLAENIVFLPLLKAVAVNTLIECCVRNTPVVVPRLSSVEEYLGPGYPLYYIPNDYTDAERVINDHELLRQGYKYLKKMNKSFLGAARFVGDVQKALLASEK